MVQDPRFPRLVQSLRERGWIESHDALHAPYGSIWVDLRGDWPGSVEAFRGVIRGRMERLSRSDVGELDDCQRETLSDAAQLLEILDAVLADPNRVP